MNELKAENEKILVRAIERGEAVLFLGAGASATSLSKVGKKIMQGWQLAAKLAEMGGLEYNDEPLPSVVTAVVGSRISREQFEAVLREEFRHCEPSPELNGLVKFTWARLYTWNLDDTVTNCTDAAQRMKAFNGLIDPVVPDDNMAFLQVVHLHGEAWKPEHGYIFSEAEYNQAISKGHPWYRQAVADYVEKLPVFIGSKLKEPILSMELDRARPRGSEGLGVAFLVTPDNFTPIQLAEFEARGIVVVKGYLSDFVTFLKQKTNAGGVSPKSALATRGSMGKALVKRGGVTASDLGVAKHLRMIADGEGGISIPKLSDTEVKTTARLFLEGKPPNWEVVFSNIPPRLDQTSSLIDQLEESLHSDERLFVAYGQSGSGKTTAVMQALKQIAGNGGRIPIYELSGNIPSLRSAINLLARLYPDEKIIVYFGETFLFGDSFAEDLLSVETGRMLFVGDARTNEWKNHIRRRLDGVNYRSFEFQRFSPEDYEELAKAILSYVPAPRFHKMSPQDRIKEFDKSRSQLLIAMKEVTQSGNFRDIIAAEYIGLPDDDCRYLFLICGVATLARSGINKGLAKEAYDSISQKRSFPSALKELDGIVFEDRNDRLVARHEIYVRHVLENVATTENLKSAIISMLRAFTKFDVPVIKNVGRQDGILFRFILNHNFLKETFRIKGAQAVPSDIYSRFELEFQRDGHFWLQYGQYLSSMKRFDEALPVLEKSIQAYPENDFAAHALADVQLRVAEQASVWNSTVVELVGHAVSTLENLHANRSNRSDQYAIATLARFHIRVLIKHKQIDAAKETAKIYFEEISRIGPSLRDEQLDTARAELLHFLTNGKTPYEDIQGRGKTKPARNGRRPKRKRR
ncbi:SIR2 family protein [uncultured Martelella sp.]|uniref:P-loop NTPase n=1 Tax=uncultured Martelella sp. TaxID=392331 RepID=UPI0029C97BBF|nr:SIR2 family protein [uncultured Martelella sp.]